MILDTNALSALFEGNMDIATLLESDDRHHLPVIVIGEFYFGILGSAKRVHLKKLLVKLQENSHVLCPDGDTAYHYGAIRYQLKRDGRPIPENDIWIAALARQFELVVVSQDKHFDFINGITRVEWRV